MISSSFTLYGRHQIMRQLLFALTAILFSQSANADTLPTPTGFQVTILLVNSRPEFTATWDQYPTPGMNISVNCLNQSGSGGGSSAAASAGTLKFSLGTSGGNNWTCQAQAQDPNGKLTSSAFTTPSSPGTSQAVYTPTVGWWYNAAESGSGWSIGYQAGAAKIFFGGFGFASSGAADWLYSTLTQSSTNVYTGTLQHCAGGQVMTSNAYKSPACSATGDTVTLTFTANDQATVTFSSGRQTTIVPFTSF